MSAGASGRPTARGQHVHTVAVAGNPNCGKTTLFNALTGLRLKVGNYPGVTVEKREGRLKGHEHITLLDLPGTYSLSAQSPDEEVARGVLLGHFSGIAQPDAVLVVVDANNLERNLYLASQVIELDLPVVIACNMMDQVTEAGHRLDTGKLSSRLGVPVIPTVAHRGEGIEALRAAIISACEPSSGRPAARAWRLPEAIEREVRSIAEVIEAEGYAKGAAAEGASILLLNEGQDSERNHFSPRIRDAITGSLSRLSDGDAIDPSLEITSARYAWLGDIVDACLERSRRQATTITDRLDRIVTHRVAGVAIFVGMMCVMFLGMFTLAEPFMGWIEKGVEAIQGLVESGLPAGALRSLLLDGAIAGVGNVIVFFPQICILVLFIALLEDTGYMARAAFLMDRLMSRVGLHGRSFIPLLSSHACAIPGIMATRTIENKRDRLVTILVAPLMSCSARLPVYIVLIAACLPASAWVKTVTIASMYTLGAVMALTMAVIFKKTILAGPTPAFIMELPPYRMPRPLPVLREVWDRSRLFLTRAGTVILAMTIVLWALMQFPHSSERKAYYERQRAALTETESPDLDEHLEKIRNAEDAEILHNSVAGRIGRFIEPALRPLGYDWKIGIGILSSIAAREVFVSTMGIVYSVGEADEASEPLREQMKQARWPDGSRVYTPLVAIGLMVFYVLACQCVSTLAVVRKETGTWRWPMFQFAYMTVLAYAGALVVYQVGTLIGFGA